MFQLFSGMHVIIIAACTNVTVTLAMRGLLFSVRLVVRNKGSLLLHGVCYDYMK